MKAILLLHGYSTDPNDFKSLIPLLSPHYDKVGAVLFPGHGRNADINNFEVEKTFEVLLKSYDELKKEYDTIDVIGFSMGGALATYLQQVREVNKLVLLAPANKFFNIRVLSKRLLYKMRIYFGAFIAKFTNKVEYEIAQRSINEFEENDKRAFILAVTRLIPQYTPKAISTFIKIVKKCNEDLKEITPPTLIIWGQLDQLVPIESIKYDFAKCTSENKKLIYYENLSHLMLHSVNVDNILEEIVYFLTDNYKKD